MFACASLCFLLVHTLNILGQERILLHYRSQLLFHPDNYPVLLCDFHCPRLSLRLCFIQFLWPLRRCNEKRNPPPNPVAQHDLRNSLYIWFTTFLEPPLHPRKFIQEYFGLPALSRIFLVR